MGGSGGGEEEEEEEGLRIWSEWRVRMGKVMKVGVFEVIGAGG